MDNKYILDTKENKDFLREIRYGLLNFGKRFPSPGGSAYHLGDDGTPWVDLDRQCYVTCRMSHVYSIGAMLGFDGSEKLVDDTIRALNGEMFDKNNDGWFSGLTKDNEIIPDKACYTHAFVILAACTASLIGRPGAKELLSHALSVYDKYFWDEENGLACDCYDTSFENKDPYRGLNANMHTVEAFLSAADVTKDEKYRERAGRIIDHVIEWAGDNNWRIPEHFSEDWKPLYEYNTDNRDDGFKPYGATPGHGLEWARLIVQWALSTYKENPDMASSYIAASENLCHRALDDAWNCDGKPGIVYTVDWEGKPVVHDRMHWVLMEAINTTSILYRVTKNEWYSDFYAKLTEYSDNYCIDHINGSFFHQMDRENRPASSVWAGKNDLYHAFQATLIPYSSPIWESIGPAVYGEFNCKNI